MHRAALTLALVLLAAAPAAAATCSFTGSPSVGFGTYDTYTTSAKNVTARIGVTCSSTTVVTASLDVGLHATSFTPYRAMLGPTGDLLNYNIYTDSTYLVVWGDGTGGTGTVTATVGTSTTNFLLYGQIPIGQDVSSGAYGDTLTMTLSY